MHLFKHFFTASLMDLILLFLLILTIPMRWFSLVFFFFKKKCCIWENPRFWNQSSFKHKLMRSFSCIKYMFFYFCWNGITLLCNGCKMYLLSQCSYNITHSPFSEFGYFFLIGLHCISGDVSAYFRWLLNLSAWFCIYSD